MCKCVSVYVCEGRKRERVYVHLLRLQQTKWNWKGTPEGQGRSDSEIPQQKIGSDCVSVKDIRFGKAVFSTVSCLVYLLEFTQAFTHLILPIFTLIRREN